MKGLVPRPPQTPQGINLGVGERHPVGDKSSAEPRQQGWFVGAAQDVRHALALVVRQRDGVERRLNRSNVYGGEYGRSLRAGRIEFDGLEERPDCL